MNKIYQNVRIGKNSSVEDFIIIGLPPIGKKEGELETLIGDNAIIRSHTIIYAGNKIGNGFQTGHHVVIRENNQIGSGVTIGSYTELAFNVKIEDDVKIHSRCGIYEGTLIKQGARLNPYVNILNTRYPYRPGKKPNLEPVIIGEFARIGANVILMPGIKIGKGALIGAGSLITKDIPDYALAYGHPAIIRGDIRDLKDAKGDSLYPL